jgi:hypothetical protein
MARDVLEPARPPRMPINLAERSNEQQEGWKRVKLGS